MLTLGVVVLVAVVVGATLWLAERHDALARENAQRMVVGAIAAERERLGTVVHDYSYWTEAYEGIVAQDMDWLISNIGSGAAEYGGTTDLIIIIDSRNGFEAGWIYSGGMEPATGLLPADVIDDMLRPLAGLPRNDHTVVTGFARVGERLWLLAATRVMPLEGVPEAVEDADLPRHVFGFLIDDDSVSALGEPFLLGDLALADGPVPDHDSFALKSVAGETVGHVAWSPPRPGVTILGQIALPLGMALGIAVLVAFLTSRQVVRSAERLERALVAAQAADRSKTEFLANVSHELRTPMNGVLGIGQILETSGLDMRQKSLLDVLMSSARAQMVLIEDLLDVARIESGAKELDMAPFKPAQALSEVIELARPRAEEKGLALRASLPPGAEADAIGDVGAFKQVLTNLIGNAVKFTESGAVTVTLETADRLDEIACRVTVADTGPGVDPKDHARIFERFTQADSSFTRKAGGAGLGLAITRSLVTLMGGEIALDSRPGEGAAFTVALRFERAAEQAAAAAA